MVTRKLIFITTILVILIPISNGNAQTVQGKVTDESGNPLDSAYIVNLNGTEHAHTNPLGIFTIDNVHISDTLQVSYVGFETKKVTISDLKKVWLITLSEKPFSLDEVVIKPKLNAINAISDIDINTNPVNTSQEVLRTVPGLVIGQHAGGGKAEQIFLRGFDIDHGTDINILVDGIPVNMTSHAHGQGYADLHFLIPETIENLNFGKGPYQAEYGNFTTAGYVAFKTKERLENSEIKMEIGQFNTQRLLAMLNIFNQENHSVYVATELNMTDGPFDSSQNFNRTNFMTKYTGFFTNYDKLSVLVSHLASKWDASGQIPQRAVDSGLISRFGAIDDTEGGTTGRTNFLVDFTKNIDTNTQLKNTLFYSLYNFELYSDFTFFLNDPVNGDQIRQKENRNLYGFTSELHRNFYGNKTDVNLQFAVGYRRDFSDNIELSHTVNRKTTLQNIMLGDIYETNYFSYLNTHFDIGKWSINPALRVDYFTFNYNDELSDSYQTQAVSKAIMSPKLNFLYNYSDKLQGYLKTGKGFHSNDTRIIMSQSSKEILPAAYGFDVGFIWKPINKILINTAYWYLFLEQEFVYVGDEGVVEPSGRTRRNGFDFSLRYQPLEWLFWDTDVNYTFARSIDEPKETSYIPLAPDFTLMSGVNIIHKSGIYGGVKLRWIDDRPANEDNSVVAIGYKVVDFNMGYQWKKTDVNVSIQNLFNTEWNETQFATETRLFDEPNPVEEIHFIPGTPFNVKVSFSYRF